MHERQGKYEEGKILARISNGLSMAICFSCAMVVVSKLISCSTRLFSVLYSNDLITRKVSVADDFGLARFVRTSEMSPESDVDGICAKESHGKI